MFRGKYPATELSAEPTFSVQTWLLEIEKKVLFLAVSTETCVDVSENALISSASFRSQIFFSVKKHAGL